MENEDTNPVKFTRLYIPKKINLEVDLDQVQDAHQ